MAAVEKLAAAGVTPIAHGGQAWQDATVFDAVAMSAGGPDFYKAAFIDLDEEALGSDTMKEAFDRMAFIRANVDENFSGRDWNLATAMVINGEAGFQMMGDWAKGQLGQQGREPGVDFDQVPFHTTPLEWDVGPAPESGDAAGVQRLEELYRDMAVEIRDLMETLRGEEAP